MHSAILVDLDDTLLDDRRAQRLALQALRADRPRTPRRPDRVPGPTDAQFARYLAAYERHWALLPGAAEFLARTRSVPKAVLSNGERGLVLRKLRALGLERHFVAVVTPESAGCAKPAPGFFLHALARLGSSPRRTLMVGDSPEQDIAPARALGLPTFLVDARLPAGQLSQAWPPAVLRLPLQAFAC
ncbi:HAD family hydrolase [Derxia lacustris]|uniref:HAD family hydrolase n=1 Tax=Derxia lacustris TaxID=764842 RepID=UPI001594A535|nr:HAD family hydrolase [Derxia lacustris]